MDTRKQIGQDVANGLNRATRRKTTAAIVAQDIRKELKEKFPNTKFSVRSQTYAGGNNVNVEYSIYSPASPKQSDVYDVVKKYQEGHFDGMTDMYEYTAPNDGKPRVKFAFVDADYGPIMETYKSSFMKDWGLSEFTDEESLKKTGQFKDIAFRRYIEELMK